MIVIRFPIYCQCLLFVFFLDGAVSLRAAVLQRSNNYVPKDPGLVSEAIFIVPNLSTCRLRQPASRLDILGTLMSPAYQTWKAFEK